MPEKKSGLKAVISKVTSGILEHMPVVQCILIVSVTVVSIYSGSTSNYVQMIITLLIFIGLEFFVMVVGYLDNIRQRVESLGGLALKANENNNILLSQTTSIVDYCKNTIPHSEHSITYSRASDINKLFEEAEHNIFISGLSCSSLYQIRKQLEAVPDCVTVNIVTIDQNAKSIIQMYVNLIGDENGIKRIENLYTSFNLLKTHFSHRPNFHFLEFSQFMPIAYTAIDYDRNSMRSLILAKHYMHSLNILEEKHFYHEVTTAHSYYDMYLHQIKSILSQIDTTPSDGVQQPSANEP